MTEWNMVAILKIMPETPEVDLEKVKTGIPEITGEKAEIHEIKETPIAFGLIALEITLLMSDKIGGMEEITEKISEMDGVGEVEVIDLNRL